VKTFLNSLGNTIAAASNHWCKSNDHFWREADIRKTSWSACVDVEVGIPAGGMTRTEQDKGQATIIIVLPIVGFFRWGDQRKSARCCYRADDCAHRCGDTKS
jgi:hypothetical protein